LINPGAARPQRRGWQRAERVRSRQAPPPATRTRDCGQHERLVRLDVDQQALQSKADSDRSDHSDDEPTRHLSQRLLQEQPLYLPALRPNRHTHTDFVRAQGVAYAVREQRPSANSAIALGETIESTVLVMR
jgi:hypothetical protein